MTGRFFKVTSSEIESISKAVVKTVVDPDYVRKGDLQEIVASTNQEIAELETKLLAAEQTISAKQGEIDDLRAKFLELDRVVKQLLNSSPSPEPEPEPSPEPTSAISRIPVSMITRKPSAWAISSDVVTASGAAGWFDAVFSEMSISKIGEYFEFLPLDGQIIFGLAPDNRIETWKAMAGAVHARGNNDEFSYTTFSDSGASKTRPWDRKTRFRVLISGLRNLEIQTEVGGTFAHYHSIELSFPPEKLFPYGVSNGFPAKVSGLVIGKST